MLIKGKLKIGQVKKNTTLKITGFCLHAYKLLFIFPPFFSHSGYHDLDTDISLYALLLLCLEQK